MPAKLLNPKVIIREYIGINKTEMLRLLRESKKKKYGFKDVAFEVDEVSSNMLYNVRMEYIA